ncbi:MAG: glycosyltransferase [Treponemataceae bacterium]|nr:glycosyltransferase [Treponemataceae bacterium]
MVEMVFFSIFIGIHVVLMGGFFIQCRRDQRLAKGPAKNSKETPVVRGDSKYPFVSVLVAVHNEAHRIGMLLESLLEQTTTDFECVFVNDRSNDETPRLLEQFQQEAQKKNIAVQIVHLSENQGPNYKQGALQKGFPLCKGEIIALTDGDCRVPPTWIQGIHQRMIHPNCGVFIGPVLKIIPKNSFLYYFQSYDHLIRCTYVTAACGLGMSTGAFGNNMAIKKVTLQDIGGYETVPFSATEDAALIGEVVSRSSWKIHAAVEKDVQVYTEPEQNWKNFFRQSLRWNKGGFFAPHRGTGLAFGFLSLLITIGSLALFVLPWQPSLWPLPSAVILAMVLNTVGVMVFLSHSEQANFWKNVQPLKRIFLYGTLLCFEPFFFSLLTIFVLVNSPVYWKGKRV